MFQFRLCESKAFRVLLSSSVWKVWIFNLFNRRQWPLWHQTAWVRIQSHRKTFRTRHRTSSTTSSPTIRSSFAYVASALCVVAKKLISRRQMRWPSELSRPVPSTQLTRSKSRRPSSHFPIALCAIQQKKEFNQRKLANANEWTSN